MTALISFGVSSSMFYTNRTHLTKHYRKGARKEFCVTHSTNNPWEWGNAENNKDFLRRGANASAHVVVDDKERWQVADYSWSISAVGGRAWRGFEPKPWLKDRIKNANSISWEMCLGWNRDNTAIIERTAADIGFVLVSQGLEIGAVVRHHDAVGKYCPFFGQLYMSPAEWTAFYKNPSGSGFWSQADEDAIFFKFKLRCEYWRLYHAKRLGKISEADYKAALSKKAMQAFVCDKDFKLRPWSWPEYPIKGIERSFNQAPAEK